MKLNGWDKKLKVLTLTTFGALTLTACSFSFTNKDYTPTTESVTSFYQTIENITQSTEWSRVANGDAGSLTEQVTEAANRFAKEENLGEFQKASLVRVVDGDTIAVEIDGEECKVRLIGINTPESVAGEEYLERTGKENTKEGKDASEYTKELLSGITEVYLQKDTSETDKYGRLLRYVWLEIPEDKTDLTEISTKMINGILVKNHIAEVVEYKPDTAYNDTFTEIYEME